MNIVSGYFSIVEQFANKGILATANYVQQLEELFHIPCLAPIVSMYAGCGKAVVGVAEGITGAEIAVAGALSYVGSLPFGVAEWSKNSWTTLDFGARLTWQGGGEIVLGLGSVFPVLGNAAYYGWTRFMDGARLVDLVPRGIAAVAG